ncbi:MAG TPA: DUF4438 domain-containing protein [Candidatus Aminicenantes bacterium]|nr:DUF4438 domain-containing protein [Candidatus Aminicenantes bacterium]HRY64369.1 DUF4438 domain-containing protein [Candidatus Aminicenantes bacterium]HRZ71282.1 DUF4438 domain-containing protein [Candidatus Aminicenantes bacterium]
MKTKMTLATALFIVLATALAAVAGPAPQTVATNRDKVLVIAVQGQIAAAQPSRGYLTTWDGKSKMAVGTGGINYNLRLGDRVFGWAAGDRATVGVAVESVSDSRSGQDAWLADAAIGNEVRLVGGEARGGKGIVVGKFGGYVLVQFPPDVLDRLAVGDRVQAKADSLGLEIEGFPDVFLHGLSPDLLDKLGLRVVDGRIEVPVVKRIPAEIVGQGAGSFALTGNWHIQTCYPPDIKAYGLDELRFGDLVLLEDTQSDYWKGHYTGGATIGVVCSGPSDRSGMGIGVTPVLSSRAGKLASRLDTAANVAAFLGLPLSNGGGAAPAAAPVKAAARKPVTALRTNKDLLIVTAVEGVVQPASAREYTTTYDGRPSLTLGMASINYRVTLGDPVHGWAQGDHVEPGVTIQGRDRQSPSECALAILSCIGNEAEVLSGEARGAKGYYIGRHAGADDKVWFPPETVEKLALNDRVRVKAKGVGLRIEGFEDVKVNKLSPEILEKLGLAFKDGRIVVPVVMEVPGRIMGSGFAGSPVEILDYDIQTTCPEVVEQYGLKKLRIGDVVAIRDHAGLNAPGRHPGAVIIGTIIHGFSDMGGHGPGVNPILSAMPGRIEVRIDPNANLANYLGIKPRP